MLDGGPEELDWAHLLAAPELFPNPGAGSPMGRERILLADHDRTFRLAAEQTLVREGYQVRSAGTQVEALAHLESGRPDLLLLEVGWAEALEWEIARAALRPCVVVAGQVGQEAHLVRCLDQGCSDLLVKPCGALELLARVRIALRRHGHAGTVRCMVSGPFRLDLAGRNLTRGGDPVPVSPTELNVLETLLGNHGRQLTRTDILHMAWPSGARPTPRTVDVHLTRLRQKLGTPGDPAWIRSAGRQGYSWVEPVHIPED